MVAQLVLFILGIAATIFGVEIGVFLPVLIGGVAIGVASSRLGVF